MVPLARVPPCSLLCLHLEWWSCTVPTFLQPQLEFWLFGLKASKQTIASRLWLSWWCRWLHGNYHMRPLCFSALKLHHGIIPLLTCGSTNFKVLNLACWCTEIGVQMGHEIHRRRVSVNMSCSVRTLLKLKYHILKFEFHCSIGKVICKYPLTTTKSCHIYHGPNFWNINLRWFQ